MSRYITIDILRGIGLLIMATNHVLIKLFPTQFYLFPSFNITNSFNMGIFIVIAGYLAYGSLHKHTNHRKWVGNKAYYLLAPHFIFNALIYPVSKLGISEWNDLSVRFTCGQWTIRSVFFDEGEWFLWILFLCFVLLLGIYKLKNVMGDGYLIGVIALTFAFIALPISTGELLRIYRLQFYFPLAIGGYLIAQYQENIVRVLTLKRFIIGSVLTLGVYALAFYLTKGNGGWGSIPFTNLFSNPSIVLLRYMQILSILPFIFLIGYGLSKVRLVSNVLAWLGSITLGVYLFSMVFTKVGIGNGWVMVVSSIVMSLVVSIVITLGLKYLVFRKVNKYVVGVR